MAKLNCWEVKKCSNLERDNCPAHKEVKLNGVHGGKNGGRSCWVVPGTKCDRLVQGSFAMKLANCLKCQFYKQVQDEERGSLMQTRDMMARLK